MVPHLRNKGAAAAVAAPAPAAGRRKKVSGAMAPLAPLGMAPLCMILSMYNQNPRKTKPDSIYGFTGAVATGGLGARDESSSL